MIVNPFNFKIRQAIPNTQMNLTFIAATLKATSHRQL